MKIDPLSIGSMFHEVHVILHEELVKCFISRMICGKATSLCFLFFCSMLVYFLV